MINKKLAVDAYRGTSFDPEKRGENFIAEFKEDIENIKKEMGKLAKSDKQKDFLNRELERFFRNYAEKMNDYLSSRSRIVSTMIAGPANFPVARMEKINNSVMKKWDNIREWADKVLKSIKKKLKKMAIEEAGGEIEVLKKKIAEAEKLQEMMRRANRIVRRKIAREEKVKLLIEIGLTEKVAKEILIPDYLDDIGYESYQLRNNRANIKRMKKRLEVLERLEQTPTSDILFDGGKIIDNAEIDRVQIVFDDIPSEEIRAKLKQRGFRWSPKNKAWQRKRTPQALTTAKYIIERG